VASSEFNLPIATAPAQGGVSQINSICDLFFGC
jgi:hypothetical protein